MKFQPKIIKRVSAYLLACLIIFESAIALIYLGSILRIGKPYPLFDMDGQYTVPSLLQAFLLFLIGFIALLFFIFDRPSSQPPSRSFSLGIAILLIYGAIDEVFKIHLQLHRWFPLLNQIGWMPLYVGLFLLPPTLFYRDFVALWRSARSETFLGFLGMAVFALGGFLGEFLKNTVLHPLLGIFFSQGSFYALFIEKSRVAFEEYFELLGETLIVYGIVRFAIERLETKRRHELKK